MEVNFSDRFNTIMQLQSLLGSECPDLQAEARRLEESAFKDVKDKVRTYVWGSFVRG